MYRQTDSQLSGIENLFCYLAFPRRDATRRNAMTVQNGFHLRSVVSEITQFEGWLLLYVMFIQSKFYFLFNTTSFHASI